MLIVIILLVIIVIVSIILIPIYFLSKWGLKKMKWGTDKNRKYIVTGFLLILFPILCKIVYKLLIRLVFIAILSQPAKKFNADDWKIDTEKRYTMSKDIIESKLLLDKTKNEISTLLGSDFIEYEDNHIGYRMGYEQESLINTELVILDIYFANNKAIRVARHGE